MSVSTILWRRIDTPGHDACRLIEQDKGWRLEGTAAFCEKGAVACVHYEIHFDREWRTQEGVIRGWTEGRAVNFRITRSSADLWRLNGHDVPDVSGCIDLDLGFTPATNLSQIRRAALRVGEATEVSVAWFDLSIDTLQRMEQRYERRTDETYWYESPRFGYSALLHVNGAGFVEQYPDLWKAER